ncbi:MAG: biotin--[Clostridia bacterium]|nr:biotin--[acetyl-CoA-carboxylase] ligase [Clostridia bacterium]
MSDRVEAQEILSSTRAQKVFLFDEIDSTNTFLKSVANENPDFTVTIANKQTAGRGRMGRSFHSPENNGIYLSILLKPQLAPDKALSITTMAAVAVAKTVEKFTQEKAYIKWVNDVFFHGKKVCGILTEASASSKDRLDYAVLGIGINLYESEQGFPEELKDIAGAIFSKSAGIRQEFIIELINAFNEIYSLGEYVEEYASRSILTGKDIVFIKDGEELSGRVLGIDADCGLLVSVNGKTQKLNCGEATIKSFQRL